MVLAARSLWQSAIRAKKWSERLKGIKTGKFRAQFARQFRLSLTPFEGMPYTEYIVEKIGK